MTVELVTRRQAVRALAAGGASVLAGCSGDGDGSTGASPNGSDPDANPDPTTGADGGGVDRPANAWPVPQADGGETNRTEGPTPTGDLRTAWTVAEDVVPAAVASSDRIFGHVPGDVIALSLDGEVEWRHNVMDDVHDVSLHGIVGAAAGERTLVTFVDEGTLVTIDGGDGAEVVRSPLENLDPISGGVEVGAGTAVYTTGSTLVGVDVATGDRLWEQSDDAGYTDFRVHGDGVYSKTGSIPPEIVTYDLRAGEERGRFAFEASYLLATDGEVVFLGHNPGLAPTETVEVSLADGTAHWRSDVPEGNPGRVGIAIDGARTFLTTDGGTGVAAFERGGDGQPAWTHEPAGGVVSEPVVGPEGLYVYTPEGLDVLDPTSGEPVGEFGPERIGQVEEATLSLAHGRVYVATPDGLVAIESAA